MLQGHRIDGGVGGRLGLNGCYGLHGNLDAAAVGVQPAAQVGQPLEGKTPFSEVENHIRTVLDAVNVLANYAAQLNYNDLY